MRIEIPKVVKPLQLSGYAAEFGEAAIRVWVNPPRAVLTQFDDIRARVEAPGANMAALSREIAEWYAQLWSQDSDPATHWTAEEVQTIINADTDPGFYGWLARETWRLINEHRSSERKK